MLQHNQLSEINMLEQLLHAAGCCRLSLNAEGLIQHLDTSILNFTGYNADELLDTPLLDWIPSEWKSRVRDWLQGLRQAATLEIPLRTRREDYCWVRFTAFPTDRGEVIALLQDITFSKQQDEALIEKNTLLQTIIDNIPMAIDAKNTKGEYILSNPTHYQILGQSSEADVIGKKGGDFLPAAMALRYDKEDQEVMYSGKTILNEERPGLPGAKVKYLNTNKVALKRADGEVIGVIGMAQDITRRKQSETELKRREEFYRTLARNLPQSAVFLYDRDLRILAAEGPALAAVQFSGTTLEGKLFSEVLDTRTPEVQELLRVYREALNGNETRMERLYGDVYYRIHVLPVLNENSEIIAGMALTQNIDEQKKSEYALRASEERNRALINAMPDLMFVAKRDGTISDFRPSLSNDVSLAVATDTQTIRQVGLPDVIIDESLMYLELALETGEIQSFEFTQTERRAGLHGEEVTARAYEVRMTALNEDEVLTLVRDMTPLKRIQEELSRHIADLTVVRQVSTELSDNLNFDYVVQLALDAAMRLSNAQTGFMAMKQGDESLKLLSIVGRYDVQQVNEVLQSEKSIIARVMRTQQPELILKPQNDPDYVPLVRDMNALMVVPLLSHERLVGVLHLETRRAERFNQERFQFLQLITGRIAAFLDNANLYRQTQEQLAELTQLYQAVAHLEQLKTDMIRIASHDLKNPLSTITVYLDMLRADADKVLTDNQKKQLQSIETSAQKMDRITKSILSLERIEQMAKERSHERVDLREQVRRAIGEQMDFAVRKNQNVTHTLPDNAIYVEGDTVLLLEALTNLIGNAIKYTPDEGRIHVSLTMVNQQATVRVEDNGYGIPEDQQERLFAPFYRVKTAETEEIEGSGLGLHLVKNIIERHDGKMVFSSTYGVGSIFGFDLPLMR